MNTGIDKVSLSTSPYLVALGKILLTNSILIYLVITKSLISTFFVTKSSSLNFSFFSDFFNNVGPSLEYKHLYKHKDRRQLRIKANLLLVKILGNI